MKKTLLFVAGSLAGYGLAVLVNNKKVQTTVKEKAGKLKTAVKENSSKVKTVVKENSEKVKTSVKENSNKIQSSYQDVKGKLKRKKNVNGQEILHHQA